MAINFIYKGLINGHHIWDGEHNGEIAGFMARTPAQETVRISAIAKLKALGFTDDEILFLFGLEKFVPLSNFEAPEHPPYSPLD
jgi:hypothetical protein